MELEKDERVVLEKSANLKTPRRKVPGMLTITNRRLHFVPFLSHHAVTIRMKDVVDVAFVKGMIKKMRVVTQERDYVFSIREAAHVVNLVRALIVQSPQDL